MIEWSSGKSDMELLIGSPILWQITCCHLSESLLSRWEVIANLLLLAFLT